MEASFDLQRREVDPGGVLTFNPFMVENLTVNLGERSYPIHFGADVSAVVRAQVDALVAAGQKIVVVTDRNLATRQSEALRMMFGRQAMLVLEPGEETKSLGELGRVLDFLAENRVDRSGALAGKEIVRIEAGRSFSVALCADGSVVEWGWLSGGQLSGEFARVPVLMQSRGALVGKTVVKLRAGFNNWLALCSDGTLVAWGSNGSGEFGNGSTAMRRWR